MSKKWFDLIEKFHAGDHPDSPESLVIGEPSSPEDIAALEKTLGVKMPDDFKDFYGTCNGFGHKDGDEVSWLFSPLDQIPATTSAARKWFYGTHPELAAGFVAFMDWDSGDYTGYVFEEDGTLVEGIFDFDHESYEADEDQDFEEFLSPLFLSIEDFFELSTE